MINGQLNMVSVPAATPPGTLESTVRVAVSMDDVPQKGVGFAELLSGIRLEAKETALTDPGETDEVFQSNDPLAPGGHVIELVAQLNSRISSSPDAEVQKLDEPEKKRVSADPVLPGSGPADVTSQTVLAAYSQPGRMPEVNIPASLPAELLQNVAIAADQPDVITAPAVKISTEQTVAEPAQASAQKTDVASVKEPVAQTTAEQNNYQHPEIVQTAAVGRQPVTIAKTASTSAVQPETSDRTSEVNKPEQAVTESTKSAPQEPAVVMARRLSGEPDAGRNQQLQSEMIGATTVDRQPVAAVQALGVYAESTTNPSSPAVVRSAPTAVQYEATLRTEDVNKPTLLPVDRLQNVAIATEESGIVPSPVVKNQTEQNAAKPMQTVNESAATVQSTVAVPISTQVLELEVPLSQSVPISARVTAPVLADNRSAALVQEIRGAQQPFTAEQQEKVFTDDEQSVEKGMAPSIQVVLSRSESTFGLETADINQNSAIDNHMLDQDNRGLLSVEHQKSATFNKPVALVPVQQDVSEQQVIPQLKERLAQHDVKPGNQQITLTLSPDSLGELKMTLNLQGQKLSVEIVTENRSVRDVIVQHTDALKESLARQNITMESFDVTTGGKGSGNQGQNQSAWRELAKQQQQQQFWAPPRGYQTAQSDLSPGQAGYRRQQGQSMLDIHY